MINVFPKIVSFLAFQIFTMLFILVKSGSMLIFVSCFRSVVIVMPSILMLSFVHSKSTVVLIFTFLFLMAPILNMLLLSKLTFRPEMLENIIIVQTNSVNVSSSNRTNIWVSSAYSLILCSLFPILIPLILEFWRIFMANNSEAMMNRYGESGHPCRTPLCKGK